MRRAAMSLGNARTYVGRATSSGTQPEEAIKLLAQAIEEIIKEVRRLQGQG
jgi:hypothetical protein